MIYPGEVIEYEVSYLGITLGHIKITTEGYDIVEGDSAVVTTARIKSAPGIPFVSLSVFYKSWIDNSVRFARKFYASEKTEDDIWEYSKYEFDYDANRLKIEKGVADSIILVNDYDTDKRWNDGLSLFFLARKYLYLNRNVGIPTIMKEDTVKTAINFVGDVEEVEIDAVDYPIKTVYFKGNANWTGVYGVTGRFEGWFSDDDARVPIQAKMKVYLGSVKIELKRWERGNWTPPRSKG